MPLHNATLIHRDDGTPYSPDFGDVYHSADGGLAQARAVFLAGNRLPRRWAGRPLFSVLETGFGIGINFLATWQAWRDDPARCGRLHYFSIEKHPLAPADLAACHARLPEVSALSAELRAQWPQALPGWHRLRFDEGRVLLTLLFADVADALPGINARFDAFYLDGFAPARNPQMWNSKVFRHCARLAAPGATLATYTAARAVRDGLAAAHFSSERLPGHGRKRHRLAAEFRPPPWHRSIGAPPSLAGSPVLVIGAGLAGAAVAANLALRGHAVTVLDAAAAPASGASGLPAALFHPHLSPDDAILSRLARNGLMTALRDWAALERSGARFSCVRDGVARPAADAAEAESMRQAVEQLHFPADYLAFLERDALAGRCGLPLTRGGCWFGSGGWLNPRALVRAQLASPGIALRVNARVAQLAHEGGLWRALDEAGRLLAEAPLAVLANSHDATRLAPGICSLRRLRGQLSLFPGTHLAQPRVAIAGRTALVALAHGLAAGSTFDEDDPEARPRAADRRRNLQGLRTLWPAAPVTDDGSAGDDCVGFRAATPDHLPLAGALPDVAAARAHGLLWRGKAAAALPRRPGLYAAFAFGSRGLVWAGLAAEIVACSIGGEPPPLENELAAAVDPARFIARGLGRGRLP